MSSWGDHSPTYLKTICPHCFSHPRHRLIALYLERIKPQLRGRSLLHYAPEKLLAAQLRRIVGEYVSADIRAKGVAYDHDPHEIFENDVDVVTNLTDLTFPSDRFDIVICSHVLEHVDDHRSALSELYRVVKPGGWALLQTPFDLGRPVELRDDVRINTPELRKQHYWQEDHVRLYGRDIFQRFSEAGFMPAIIPPGMVCSSPSLFGLWPTEDLMLARKLW